jgi:hypothetical protein
MVNPSYDQEFSQLLSDTNAVDEHAPSSLKAKLYSALIREQQGSGPLASLSASVAAGHGICIFEQFVQIAPIGESAKSPFFCNICHARLLAESFDNPPIFWPHCPYVGFKDS